MSAQEQHQDESFAASQEDDTAEGTKSDAPAGNTAPTVGGASAPKTFSASPYQPVGGINISGKARSELAGAAFQQDFDGGAKKYVAYTIKLPSDQLAALQTIWLELKRLYGTHSPDKSGMIQQAITDWLRRWDGPDRAQLLQDLLEIRQDTRRRQYRK